MPRCFGSRDSLVTSIILYIERYATSNTPSTDDLIATLGISDPSMKLEQHDRLGILCTAALGAILIHCQMRRCNDATRPIMIV